MSHAAPVGVLLAGGRGRRMGVADKSLVHLDGRPLVAFAIERLSPQVGAMVINANGDPRRFDRFDLSVVPDEGSDFKGPLAGILAGVRWAEGNSPAARHIVTVATDTPFFPLDLVPRLESAASTNRITIARSRNRLHRVFGLFPVDCGDHLDRFVQTSDTLRVGDWLTEVGFVTVDFDSDPSGRDPFFNINTPDDLATARLLLAAASGVADGGQRIG